MKAHKIEEIINNESRLIKLETIVENTQRTLDRLDNRFDQLENKVDIKIESLRIELKNDIKEVDKKLSSFKIWIVGIGASALISVAGEILNIALKMSAK